MKFRTNAFVMSALLIGVMSFAGVQAFAQSRNSDNDGGNGGRGRTLIVDDNLQCPGSSFNTIQAAVNAASNGDTIKVCPGTYNEQVRISKDITVRGVSYMNQDAAVVKPNVTAPNSSDGIAAIILAENSRNVELENLTVDGASNNINSCNQALAGIYYHNASGEVERMAVRNIRLGAGLTGCQNLYGILVQSDNNRRASVEVVESSVHDYQKNGITANNAGTELYARGNAVSGLGPTPDIAQNGIQIGFGARGSIEGNTVINNNYSQCTAAKCDFVATNILIYQSDNVRIANNTTGKSNVNIFVLGNRADVSGNTILDSDVFDGIDLVGNNNKATGNSIFNSDDAGVFVQGNRNSVKGNLINEAREGVLEQAPSSNNDLNDNRFYNVEMKVVPAGGSMLAADTAISNVSRANASPAQP
jgi:hypothetical protein